MPAITFKELKQNWDDGIEDERYTINYYVNIDDSVRIEPYCIIEEDVKIGANSIIGAFVHIRPHVTIGKNCKIGSHTTFESKDGYQIIIGNNVRIGTNCNLPYNTLIEDNVFFGNGSIIANDKTIQWPLVGEFKPGYSHICKGAKIGLNSTILPNLIIGENVVVGAGSVLTKSVLRDRTVYGNPARKSLKEEQKEHSQIYKEILDKIEKLENSPTYKA